MMDPGFRRGDDPPDVRGARGRATLIPMPTQPRRGLTLPFRQRILVVLIALGAVPTAIAIFGWALTIRTNNPATAARAAVEGVGNSGRVLVETIDTTRLRPSERRALAAHAEALNRALVRTQAAEAYGQYYYYYYRRYGYGYHAKPEAAGESRAGA